MEKMAIASFVGFGLSHYETPLKSVPRLTGYEDGSNVEARMQKQLEL